MLSEALICHVKGGKQMAWHTRIPDAQYGNREYRGRMPGLSVSDGKRQSGSLARFWRLRHFRYAPRIKPMRASLSQPGLIPGTFSPDAAYALDLAAIRLD